MVKGMRSQFGPSALIPKNWKDFVRVYEKKTELLSVLSHQVIIFFLQKEDKTVYETDCHNLLAL